LDDRPLKLFSLVGPTGVGKTELAVNLALKYNLEIISVDSRQIYKFLDIGTAKPNAALRKKIKFHFIDIVTPDVLYSAGDFARDCRKLIYELLKENRKFILVGGSGLYFKALFSPFFEAPRNLYLRRKLSQKTTSELYQELEKIDPLWARRINPQDQKRIVRALEIYYETQKPPSAHLAECPQSEFLPYYVGITMPRARLYEKINHRFEEMINQGLVNEIQNLLNKGYSEELNSLNTIGYKELIAYLKGRISLSQAIRKAQKNSRDYAKRQLTWFKKIPGIRWIELTEINETNEKLCSEYENYLKEIPHN
jgi:tRNA dimethylallyltransferase